MVIYNIETKLGWCKCYEQNGVYYCLNEDDQLKFNFEPILSIERE